MTDFVYQASDGSYAVYAARDAAAPAWLYILVPASATPPALVFGAVWVQPGPWALIVRAAAWDCAAETPSAAATTLGLPALAGSQSAVLAWRQASIEAYQALVLDWTGSATRQVRAPTALNFGNVTLSVPVVSVTLGDNGDSLHLARTGSQFGLARADVTMSLLLFSTADLALSPSGGVAPGGLGGGPVNWRARQVCQLGQDAAQISADAVTMPELRYWQDTGTGAWQRLRLPLFPPADYTTPNLTCNFTLNPALPFDPSATRFDIADASNACFTSAAALLTREGAAVGCAPVSGIGFHLAAGADGAAPKIYLAPYGRFSLGGSANSLQQLMPGLSGLERIEAMAGDILELVPGQPAFGAAAGAGADEAPRLTDDCTTSWLRLTPTGAASRDYYAQPLASVFYASADGTALPRAADALVATLTGDGPAFPLAPYANALQDGVNPGVTAAAIMDFEHTYLSGVRGAALGSQAQPVFSIDGKVLTMKGATPRGLLAEIGPTPAAASAALRAKNGKRLMEAALAATPAGQCRRIYLARGANTAVSLEPDPVTGAVDPVIGNALMQPDLFLVYNNWASHPINLAGELDLGGFSFDWAPLATSDQSMLLVAKFTAKVSLQDLFNMPERWRDAATLANVTAAQNSFTAAMQTAQAGQAAGSPLFDDFLTRIAGSAGWTGILVLQAPVDGNAMPPTLQILIAGMQAPLRAHHLAVDVTVISAQNGVPQDVGPSSAAGVISYDDPGTTPPAGGGDFGFYTQSLKVGFAGSVVTSFNAEVGLQANQLFGRAVALEPVDGDPKYPNTFTIKGIYHLIAGVATVSFQLQEARVFDFPTGASLPGGAMPRILSQFKITQASILPQASTGPVNGITTEQAQITLAGALWFAADPFAAGIDLFSYGAGDTGLTLDNFGLEMTFQLDAQGQRVPNSVVLDVDYSRLAVSATADAVRPGALLAGLPLTLKGILADDDGLDTGKLGGKPVHVLQIAGKETDTPHFALQFELIIGSLGELSGVHAGLTAEMRLAWGPLATTPDADGALLTVQLPGASGGFDGLNVQGMLQLVFGDANLMKVTYKAGNTSVYALLFNNVALSVMGIKLPPKVVSDLILFSDPANAASSSLAACLAVMQ